MLQILGKIPKEPFAVACSGGIDSMVLVDFLRKFPGNKFELLYFNHGTEHGQEAEEFLTEFCERKKLKLHIGRISREKIKGESFEEYWRNERYKFFDTFELTVLMAHHLGDCTETYLFTTLRGNPKLIPHIRGNYFRPFLKVSKMEILKWAEKHNVEFIEDPSNTSLEYSRNKIRHQLMPVALSINPGLETTIRKLIDREFESCSKVCYN